MRRVSVVVAVLGTLLASLALSSVALADPIEINFQPSSAPTYGDYLIDDGSGYGARGNGYSYGWKNSSGVPTGLTTVDRNLSNSPDQRYDTLAIWGEGQRKWEIAVPNGDYIVALVAGDPAGGNSNFVIDFEIEGETFLTGTSSHTERWFDGGGISHVTDGKLTMTAGDDALNNKINFIILTPTDVTAPTVTFTSPIADQVDSATAISAAFTADETADSECKLDAGSYSACASPASFSSLSTGTHTLTVKATDASDNVGTGSVSFYVDPAAPVKINFQPAAAPTYQDYRVDGGEAYGDRGNGHTYGWSNASSGTTVTTTDRNHSNSADQRYDTFTTFGNGPEPHWDLAVSNGDYHVRVVAGDSAGGSSDYRINAEGSSIVSGVPTSTERWFEGTGTRSVSDGKLTISSETSAVNNKVDFAVVSPRPIVEIVAGPANGSWTEDTTPTMTFEGSHGADFDCQVDGGAWESCSSPTEVPELEAGEHTFGVRATRLDLVGDSPAERTFQVGAETPAVYVSLADGEIVVDAQLDTAVDMAISSSDNTATIADAGSAILSSWPCLPVSETSAQCPLTSVSTSAISLTDLDDNLVVNLPEGVQSQIDGKGGDDKLAGGAEDDTFRTEPGDDEISGGGATDVFDASESPSGVTISLDGVANDGMLGEKDNISPTIKVINGSPWADDLIGSHHSEMFFGNGGDDFIRGGGGDDQLFGGLDDDTLDGGEGADLLEGGPGVDEVTYEDRGVPHEINNGGGSTNPSGENYGAEGDELVDSFEIVRGGWGDDTINGTSISEVIDPGPGSDEVSAGGGDDEILSRDGEADTIDCEGDVDTLEADVIDGATNCETNDSDYSVEITDGPEDDETISDNTPTFELEADFDNLECQVDELYYMCSSEFTTEPLDDGEHNFTVRVVGGNGEVGTEVQRSLIVDTEVPFVVLESEPDGASADDSPEFEFSSNDSTALVECAVDSGTPVSCASPYSLTRLSVGSHIFVVTATDAAGNNGSAVNSFEVVSGSPNVAVDDGTLTVSLANGVSHDFRVDFSSGELRVRDNGAMLTPGRACRTKSTHVVRCAAGDVALITVQGGDQSDGIFLSDSVFTPALIYGGAGDDTITGGSSADAIYGGDGSDDLDGGWGSDSVFGESGNDQITSADGASDTIECGADSGDTAVVDALDAVADCESDESRTVVSLDNAIFPFSLAYVVVIAADGEINQMHVKANSRRAVVTDRNNEIWSGAGCGRLDAHSIACTSASLSGAFVAAGDQDDDVTVSGTEGVSVSVDGGPGADTLKGGTGSESLFGGPGPDRLEAAGGGDYLYGDDGDDVFISGPSNDSITGGAGDDLLDYSSFSADLQIDLENGTVIGNGVGSDSLDNSFESAKSGTGDDEIVGNELNNHIDAGEGADTVDSGEGHDTIIVRDGEEDSVDCGPGTDSTETDSLDSLDTSCESDDNSAVARITNGPHDGQTLVESVHTFEFLSDNPLAFFQCSVDSGSFSTCASPFSTSSLTEGLHTFAVRAVDSLGAAISDTTTRTFAVDTIAPSLTVSDGPADQGVTSKTSPIWSFESDDPSATFYCSIDGADHRVCATPFSPRLGRGGHTMIVLAVDAAGNASMADERTIFIVDAADVGISTGSEDGAEIVGGAAEFEFESENALSFECAEDGGPYESCATPYEFESDYSGTRTFAVRAIDADGSPGIPDVRSVEFADGPAFVDQARPVTQLDLAPADGSVVYQSPTLEFSSSEPGTFMCRLNDQEWEDCESPLELSELAPEGEKIRFEVAAVDAAANFTERPAAASFTYRPGSVPSGVADTVDVLTNVFPDALEPAGSIELPSVDELEPALKSIANEDDGDPGNEDVTTGTMAPTSIGRDLLDGFAIDTTAGEINFALDESPTTSSPSVSLGGVVSATRDAGNHADVVLRPNVGGLDLSVLVRSIDGAADLIWEVDLEPDQRLVELTDGSVAVVGPLPRTSATEADALVEHVDPSSVIGDGADAYAAQVGSVDAAGDETDDAALLVLRAPSAKDANDDAVATTLSVDTDGRSVKLSVNPARDPVMSPVIARSRADSNQIATRAAMRSLSGKHVGLAGGHPDAFVAWPGLPGNPNRGDALIDRMKDVTGGPSTTGTLRILIPWDAADDHANLACENGVPTVDASVGENPYNTLSRCWHLWKTQREILNAWTAAEGNIAFYISPDQVLYTENHAEPGVYGVNCKYPGRHQIPCTTKQFQLSFSRLYTALQTFARDRLLHSPRIRFWSGFNEPDLLLNQAKTKVYGPRPRAVGPEFAASTYATVAKTLESDATFGCKGDCYAFAGEFAFPNWASTPAANRSRYAYRYVKEIVRRVNRTKKMKAPNRLRPPGMWSFHAYGDISGATKAASDNPQEHGTAPFHGVKSMYQLTRSQRALRRAKVWMTEGGVRYDVSSPQPPVNQNTAESRNKNVPRAVRRFLYLLQAGTAGTQNDGFAKGDRLAFFKNVKGALYYQLASVNDKFDSSLFESTDQRASCNWSADDADGCDAGVPAYPRPRPAYCVLMGVPPSDCKGDNRPSSQIAPAAPLAAAGRLRIASAKTGVGGADIQVKVRRSLGPEPETVSFAYKARLTTELCYVDMGGESAVWAERAGTVQRGEFFGCQEAPLCLYESCFGVAESSSLLFDIPANADFSSVVPSVINQTLWVRDPNQVCEVNEGMKYVITPKLTLFSGAADSPVVRERNLDPDDDTPIEDFSVEDAGAEYVGSSGTGAIEGAICN